MKIAGIRKELGIENKDIAKAFGYKNLNSYQCSSKKKSIENGIMFIYQKTIQIQNK